jgi:hypothetical protein
MGNHSVAKHEKLTSSSLFDLRVQSAAGQAISVANRFASAQRRLIARNLGAAAGGLLGFAVLPLAIANADDFTVTPDPTSIETITGIYGAGFAGEYTTPPAVGGTVQGYQLFDYTDTTTGATGSFNGDESNMVDGLGDINQEVLVTQDVSGDALPIGSVIDSYTIGDSGYVNIYSAVPSTSGGDLVTDTWVTPYGSSTVPLTFDAADVSVADANGVPLGDGEDFLPITSTEQISSINGIPPFDKVLQGYEHFDVDNAAGTPVGSFAGDEATTSDIAGTYTEAVLVTKDLSGNDTPPVGSIFNTINFGGWENFYSDLTSSSGGADTVSDTLVSPWGEDFTIPVTFDAVAIESPVSIDLPDGQDIIPVGSEVFTGLNGLPPADLSIQGQQQFDLLTSAGTQTFDADVTKTLDLSGDTTQTLLVTSGNEALPTGSVIETVGLGDGYENIYSSIASLTVGQDTITDTLVTPLGDIPLSTTLDASAGLALDNFLNLF